MIGSTGFVGSILAHEIPFVRAYNSKTIESLAGTHCTTLVCAGAPATMWAANANPDQDLANLQRLIDAVSSCSIDRLVLISTVGVLDDPAAGYDEMSFRFETKKAYGRHRRLLEETLQNRFPTIVLRLPALFGPGLKKNFIFDLLNPVPSFVTSERFAETLGKISLPESELLKSLFSFEPTLGMHRLDRQALDASENRIQVEDIFARIGFLARNFTNSDSQFQFYNTRNLKRDIENCVEKDIPLLHVCSEPIRAADACRFLLGEDFVNHSPMLVREDMRTKYAADFGTPGAYLYDRETVMHELRQFFECGRRE